MGNRISEYLFLKEIGNYLPEVFNSIQDGILILDKDLKIIEGNRWIKEQLITEPSIAGKYCYKALRNKECSCDNCPALESIETGKEAKRTIHFTSAENSSLYLEINTYPVKNSNGEVIRIFEHMRDVTEAKLAEQELIESKERYKAIYQNAPLAFHSLDKKGNIIDVNPQWLKTLGYKKDEVVGKWFGNFLPEEFKERFRKNFETLKKRGEVNDVEYDMLCKNESRIAISIDGKAGYSSDGTFLHTYCTFKDITEKIEIQSNLHNEKNKLTLRNQIAEIFLNNDQDKVFFDVLNVLLNKFESSYGFFGYINKEGDLVCPSLTYDIWDKCQVENKEFIFPKENWGGMWGESLKNKTCLIKNGGLKVPQGHIMLENSIACAIKFNNILIGQIALANKKTDFSNNDQNELNEICNYISPLLKASVNEIEYKNQLILSKQQAEELNKRFEYATAIGKVGTWDWDLLTDELIWSSETYRILGYTPFSVIPSYDLFLDLVHPDDRQSLDESVKAAWYEKKLYSVDCRIILKDGEKICNATGVVDYNKTDKPIRMVGTFQDITERKKIEQELVVALQKAEESERLKSAFLANMSHEIRTPMNGIIGFLDILQSNNITKEEQQNYLEIIKKSSDRLITTINDIIQISRIEANQVTFSKEKVVLKEIMAYYTDFFSHEVKAKGIEFDAFCNCAKQPLTLFTDKNKLTSILTNLFKNAIKFTQNGKVSCHCYEENEHIKFAIKDSGIGIPKERQNAIFDRFVQADLSISRGFEGSGLGLSIVKAYVEMLGGKIWVESEVGVGSTFYFTILNEKVKDNQLQIDYTLLNNKVITIDKNIKVLVVEDEDVGYLLLETVLTHEGFEVVRAQNGKEAVEIFKQNSNFDLILMDLKMPVMDGFEATRKIRAFDLGVPIIAQTAFALEGDREKAIEAGCTDYVSKPVNKKELFEKMNKILS